MFGFLGLMLGVTAGALTGVAIKGLISDPVVTGGGFEGGTKGDTVLITAGEAGIEPHRRYQYRHP